MPKVILLPLLATAGGFGGFLLRRWELTAVFDASGLAVPWAPATVALILWSLLIAVVFFFFCRNLRNELKGYDDSFTVPNYGLYLPVIAMACACLLLAGVFGLYGTFSGGAPGLLRLLLWVLCLISLVCIVYTTLANFRGQERKFDLMLLLPAYTFCVWLVVAYQKRAADPVVLDYMYELFAIVCALLAFYFTAGFSFSKPKVWPCSIFCLLAVYFGIVTLADGRELEQRLLVLFSILYHLATVTVLLYNAFAIKPKRLLKSGRMPARAKDKTDRDTSAE